jgi:nitrogen-specific signal transduction histidine kinase
MNKAETKSLSELSPNAALAPDDSISQLLHDVKNQLGGVKLYAAVLKKSLANNTLDATEGIAICEKIIQKVDELAARTKATARGIDSSTRQS